MKAYVRVEFCIDDVIAWHCVQNLLNNGVIRITKTKVITECKAAFYSNGSVFETEPCFDQSDWIREVDDEHVQRIFDKIWK